MSNDSNNALQIVVSRHIPAPTMAHAGVEKMWEMAGKSARPIAQWLQGLLHCKRGTCRDCGWNMHGVFKDNFSIVQRPIITAPFQPV